VRVVGASEAEYFDQIVQAVEEGDNPERGGIEAPGMGLEI
jgi:hypothetical protein